MRAGGAAASPCCRRCVESHRNAVGTRTTPELPLLRAMAAMLAEARHDCALDAVADLSHAQFLEDPEQQAWRESVAPGIRGADGRIPGVCEE